MWLITQKTVLMRRFYCATSANVKSDGYKNSSNLRLNAYLDLCQVMRLYPLKEAAVSDHSVCEKFDTDVIIWVPHDASLRSFNVHAFRSGSI